MAPVDLELIGSSSDDQSEQINSVHMSRVVPAVFVILGVLGTAFMLGHSSAITEAAPTDATELTLGAFTAGLPQAFADATSGKQESEMVGICNTLKTNETYASLADQVWLACRPRCQGRVPAAGEAETVTSAHLTALESINATEDCPDSEDGSQENFDAKYNAMTVGICDAGIALVCAEFKKTCTSAGDTTGINTKPRCAAVTVAPALGVFTADLPQAFANATSGKKESEMVGICNTLKTDATYANLADQVWLACRPRCQGRVPAAGEADSVTTAHLTALESINATGDCPDSEDGSQENFDAKYNAMTVGMCDEGINLVCKTFKATCTSADDMAGINTKPRCAAA